MGYGRRFGFLVVAGLRFSARQVSFASGKRRVIPAVRKRTQVAPTAAAASNKKRTVMTGRDLRLVYMGTPDFAVGPLRRLVEEGYKVVAVVISPDKPAGRGLKMQESAVKKYAVEAGLPVLQPVKLKDPAFLEELKSYAPDLGIVIAFRMLPEVVWAMPESGTFNLHASLLPEYRGAAPINWSIINGETVTGVTTFMLNDEIDKGDIIGQTHVPILPEDNAGTLHDKLARAGEILVLETVEAIGEGIARPMRQSWNTVPGEQIKEAPKIFKETCRIDWSWPAVRINNLIRGLSPYPAAWSELKNRGTGEPVPVKIYKASVEIDSHNLPVGTIVATTDGTIKTACADGYIDIEELQVAGKKRMTAADFLRGFKNIGEYVFE